MVAVVDTPDRGAMALPGDWPQARGSAGIDYDWAVIGSGFGGSVAALRLVEKGYRVLVLEKGRRWSDAELPGGTDDKRRFLWSPRLGLTGIMTISGFRHLFSSSQIGVGGGSLVYGGVLFRPHSGFYDDPQWRDLGPWQERLQPHFTEAERMLGARTTPWESAQMQLMRRTADHLGARATFSKAPTGVYFGAPGLTVDDPYFGGDGPPRTGCTRCGACMTGCRTGAANSLTKNYLWFAERSGAHVVPRREVVDVRPIGAADGTDGYEVTSVHSGTLHRRRETVRVSGVVFAGGGIGTNQLLAMCKRRGSLPRLSERLGCLVRTNSESVMSVLLPEDRETWRDVAASSRVIVDGNTQVEFLTYGRRGDFMRVFFTLLAPGSTRPERLKAWGKAVVRHPARLARTLRGKGWSRRTVMMLVMQPYDNALAFTTVRRRLGRGWRLVTRADPQRPAPVALAVGHEIAEWLARETGGIPQGSVFEALGDRTFTAHVLGGAVIGADPDSGVVDENQAVFGYANMLVTDSAALPANPGVNPALTITALAEHALAQVPVKPGRPDVTHATDNPASS
jgi:cholesterol oxidase